MGIFDPQVTQNLSNPSSLAGQPTPQPQGLYRAMVLYSIASLNLYLLESLEGPLVFNGMTFYGCDSTPMTPYGNGVSGGYILPPGTRVLVQNSVITSMAEDSDSLLVYPIVSVDNEMPSAEITWYPPWRTLTAEGFKNLTGKDLDDAVRGLQGIEPTDRLRGKPVDLCPGDWSMTNPSDGGLFVGGDRVSMEGGPIAGIHMYSSDSTVMFNKGLTYVEDQPWRRSASYTDIDSHAFDMEMVADSTSQAMGYQDGDPSMFKPEVKDLEVSYGNKIEVNTRAPQWTDLNYKGLTNGGKILQRVVERKRDGTPQPGHMSFDGADGRIDRSAAHSLTFRRSPNMPYLELLRELDSEDKPDDTGFESMEDVTNLEQLSDIKEYASQYADLMYMLMQKKFVERYWAAQKARSKDWKALSIEDLAAALGRAIDETLQPLGEDEPCYPSKTIDVADPIVREGKLTLSQLESYLHLSPTGALIISDGTGSEIRLEGGNIILSPAADFRIQPGRDLSITVPRTASLFAGGRIDIASDSDEIDIHADKNITVSAEGLTTIESRMQGNTTDAAYDKRGEGGGLVLRSASETHVIGNTVRVALQGPRDKSKNGVADASTGMLVFDTGSRDIVVNSGTFTVNAQTDVLLTAGELGASFSLRPEVTAISNKSLLVAGTSLILGGDVTSEVVDVRKRESRPSKYHQGEQKFSIAIDGSMIMTGAFAAFNVLTDKVVARHMHSLDSADPTESIFIPPQYRAEYGRYADTYKGGDDYKFDYEISREPQSYWVYNTFNPLWTADGIRRVGIYYPASDLYHQDKCFWVASRWQRNLAAGPIWTPKDIMDEDDKPMLPYPGYGSWKENDSYTVTWDPDGNISKGALGDMWRVNCTIK